MDEGDDGCVFHVIEMILGLKCNNNQENTSRVATGILDNLKRNQTIYIYSYMNETILN